MKKTFFGFFSILLVSFLVSCQWQIPEKISLKTAATFNFSIGNVEKDFNTYFDTSTLLGSSFGNATTQVYDYYPNKTDSKIKKLLVKMPIQEIPIDFGAFFDETSLAANIKALSFEKEFTMPDFAITASVDVKGSMIAAAALSGTAIPVDIKLPNETICEIAEGTMTIQVILPPSWSGVTVTVNENGGTWQGLTLPASHTPSTNGIITLDGSTTDGTNLWLKPTVEFGNATNVDLSQNVTIKVNSSVKKFSYVNVSLDSLPTTLSDDVDITPEIINMVESIILDESGLKGSYINTLPAGNDIKISVKSDFLNGLDNTSSPQVIAANTTTRKSFTIFEDNPSDDVTKFSTTHNPGSRQFSKIEFNIGIGFPTQTSPITTPTGFTTFVNVTPNTKYAVGISLEPVIDWKKISINAGGTPQSDVIPTGLDIANIFNSFASQFGLDFSHIGLKSLPVSLYLVKPDMSCFDNAGITGSVKMVYGQQSGSSVTPNGTVTPIDFVPAGGTMPFAQMPQLQFEGETVINDVNTYIPSSKSDIAAMLNQIKAIASPDPNDKIFVDYTLTFSNGSGSTLTITKADYLASKNGTSSIAIYAYIVLPLEFNATQDTEIDLLAMVGANSGSDLLSRTEPPDYGMVGDMFAGIQKMSLNYDSSKIPFYGNPEPVAFFLDWDGDATTTNDTQILSLDGGELNIANVGEILNTYPLTPSVKVKIAKGDFSIPRSAELQTRISLQLKMDPDYKLYIMGGD